MKTEIKGKYPLDFNKEYFAVAYREKDIHKPCDVCDEKGVITINKKRFICPQCH